MNKHSPYLLEGLLAGFIAITVNALVLKAAPLFHIQAESGGLLKLILLHSHDYFGHGMLLYFETALFWLLFHYLTGFSMVLIYLYIFEPLLAGRGWLKGSLFSLFPWMINGLIVLPLLRQGILGIHQLSTAGIIYFFIANWLFGWLLGVAYERGTYSPRK